ncbi:MAG TPA: tail fiber protein [Cellvibrio sp.]|nr:tail fiber protein [Cellvibrio sp.]
MDPYLGDIRLFAGNFAPAGWVICDGRLLAISENDALYAIVGTTYGGDGIDTFAVPDLRGRLPVGQGSGVGLSERVIGQKFGVESVTLLTPQIPSHNHSFNASTSAPSTSPSPAGTVFAHSDTDKIYVSSPTGPLPETLNTATVQLTGGTQPHTNIMPTTAINYIMSTVGIFPSRN